MSWEFFPEVDSRMSALFMNKLVQFRREIGESFPVTSSYREDEENIRVGGAKFSAHLLGRAVDIHCYGNKARVILERARAYGFHGVGTRQHGSYDKRFIHLDDIRKDEFSNVKRPWIWTYP